jgi:hypothetical protein
MESLMIHQASKNVINATLHAKIVMATQIKAAQIALHP